MLVEAIVLMVVIAMAMVIASLIVMGITLKFMVSELFWDKIVKKYADRTMNMAFELEDEFKEN